MQLSAVVITYNEERFIGECLTALEQVADEIIVVDGFSKDKTPEICKSFSKVKFFESEWLGYSKTKNWGNEKTTNNWILSIDADEILSPELIIELNNLKKGNKLFFTEFKRLTNYCGTWIKHGGWYPDVKLRLFDKSIAKWEGELHEKIVFKGLQEIRLCQNNIYHYSYTSISSHILQADKFTSIGAEELFKKGKKTTILKAIASGKIKFLKDYFFRFGFLDGYYGFIVALISSWASFLKYAKLIQLHRDARRTK